LDWAKREKDHTEQAVHNEVLLDHIRSNLGKDFFDWRVAVAFYVCVHSVDAKLATKSVAVRDHLERNMHVAGNLAGISTDYLLFYTESKNARYDPEYRITVDESRVQMFEKMMGTIKTFVPK